MTDTPPGASADARVHGDASALAAISVTKLAAPRLLSPAEADAVFRPQTLEAPPAEVVIDDGRLKPYVLALVRWLMHGLGIWLISRGLRQDRVADLEPILTGLMFSGLSLAWSLFQKELQLGRIVRAARALPSAVVLRR